MSDQLDTMKTVASHAARLGVDDQEYSQALLLAFGQTEDLNQSLRVVEEYFAPAVQRNSKGSRFSRYSKSPTRYGGQWVTMGAKKDDKSGKKKGGVPVYLDESGKIKKGPAALKGKTISELDKRPKAKKPKTKLDFAIQAAVGDAKEDVAGFRAIVQDVWEEKRRITEENNRAYNELLANFIGQKAGYTDKKGNWRSSEKATQDFRGAFVRNIQKARDPDDIPKFDELVYMAQNTFPELLQWSQGAVDEEDALFQRLQQGLLPIAAKHDDEVIDEALSMVTSIESQAKQADDDDMPDWLRDFEGEVDDDEDGSKWDDEDDDFDFSKRRNTSRRRLARRRYWRGIREAIQYARKGPRAKKPSPGQKEFRWITIGGHEDGDRKHKGGSAVQINNSGDIVGGPQWVADMKVDNLDDFGKDHDERAKEWEAREEKQEQHGVPDPDEVTPEKFAANIADLAKTGLERESTREQMTNILKGAYGLAPEEHKHATRKALREAGVDESTFQEITGKEMNPKLKPGQVKGRVEWDGTLVEDPDGDKTLTKDDSGNLWKSKAAMNRAAKKEKEKRKAEEEKAKEEAAKQEEEAEKVKEQEAEIQRKKDVMQSVSNHLQDTIHQQLKDAGMEKVAKRVKVNEAGTVKNFERLPEEAQGIIRAAQDAYGEHAFDTSDSLEESEKKANAARESLTAKSEAEKPQTPTPGEMVKIQPATEGAVPLDVKVHKVEDGRIHFGHGDNSHISASMPIESWKHFQNDLQGKVDVEPNSGIPEIDAVASGEAEFLGKGDDGLAFKVGDKVVKASTTVPYVPFNDYHRSPEQAAQQLEEQVATNEKLREMGVPGILPMQVVRHGDKSFAIMDHVDTNAELTQDHKRQIQGTLKAMHDAGYVLGDQIQTGVKDGQAYVFDTGKAGMGGEWAQGGDMDNFRSWANDHGLQHRETTDLDKSNIIGEWRIAKRQLEKANPELSPNRAAELAAAKLSNRIRAEVGKLEDKIKSGEELDLIESSFYDSIHVDGWRPTRQLEELSGSRTIIADSDDPLAQIEDSPKSEPQKTTESPAKINVTSATTGRSKELDAESLDAEAVDSVFAMSSPESHDELAAQIDAARPDLAEAVRQSREGSSDGGRAGEGEAEKPTAIKTTGISGKSLEVKPDSLDADYVQGLFNAALPSEHEQLAADIAAARPDLAAHADAARDMHAQESQALRDEIDNSPIEAGSIRRSAGRRERDVTKAHMKLTVRETGKGTGEYEVVNSGYGGAEGKEKTEDILAKGNLREATKAAKEAMAKATGLAPGGMLKFGGEGEGEAEKPPTEDKPGRFIIQKGDEYSTTDDILKHKEDNPYSYGVSYYDTQKGEWVKPGKRGPVKDRTQKEPIENIKNRIERAGGLMTTEEMEQSFRDFDDTFTEFDRKQHERARKAAQALGMIQADGESEAEKPQPTIQAISDRDANQAIQIAADSIEKLRKPDVYRVLDAQEDPDRLRALKGWIADKRPELQSEAEESFSDIMKERIDSRFDDNESAPPQQNHPTGEPSLSEAEKQHEAAMDIHSGAELRTALREYLSLRGKKASEDPVKKAERDLIGRKIPGFFPTPPTLVDKMLDAADIQDGHAVLEPSAGKGDILDAISNRHPNASAKGIEHSGALHNLLALKGHDAERGDFLQHKGEYDRIVMNPPFEQGADMQHVQHAYDNLKPGGKMVAVMSSGAFQRGDKKTQAFRDWFESVGGDVEDLPAGSFAGSDAFRQTGVNTKLAVIEKSPEKLGSPIDDKSNNARLEGKSETGSGETSKQENGMTNEQARQVAVDSLKRSGFSGRAVSGVQVSGDGEITGFPEFADERAREAAKIAVKSAMFPSSEEKGESKVKPKTVDHKTIGFFKTNKAGKRVFQVRRKDLTSNGIEVGDSIQPMNEEWDEDGDSFQVAAIGEPFYDRNLKTHVYLYLDPPAAQSSVTEDVSDEEYYGGSLSESDQQLLDGQRQRMFEGEGRIR